MFPDEETASLDYARRFGGPIGEWLLTVQTRLIDQLLETVASARGAMVDIGGGHAQIWEPLRDRRDIYIHGTSVRAFHPKLNSGACRLVATFTKLPFADRSIDVVSSIRLLTHAHEWRAIVAEMCRVSRHAVLIDYPPLVSSNILYRLFFPLKKRLEGNTRTFSLFTHREIADAFAAQGFCLAKRAGQFLWPMVVHRALKNPRLSEMVEAPFRRLGAAALVGSPTLALFVRSADQAGACDKDRGSTETSG